MNPKTGKRNPIDADPVRGGNISLIGYDADDTPELAYGAPGSGPYVSHFSTCADSRDWKRSR